MPERGYKYVIRCIRMVGIARNNAALGNEDRYLQAYDPEYMNGEGMAVWTKNPNNALFFPTKISALRLVDTVPRSKPVREDGMPNRPLRAYTLEIMLITEAIEEYEHAKGRGS